MPFLQAKPAPRALAVLIGIVGLTLTAIVAYHGYRVIRSAREPFDIDQFRDLASAQSFVDGHGFRDPFYQGERLWYSPGVPALVGALAKITKTNVALVYVRIGPFLNALGPFSLFLLAWVVIGYRSALAALLLAIFLPSNGDPAWASPTFSPWMFPATVAVAFFSIGLLAVWSAARKSTLISWGVVGAWIGCTFLVHVAPSLILSACAIVIQLSSGERRTTSIGRRLLESATLVGAAAVVASPLLWSIVVHYHLHVVNPAPAEWLWPPLASTRILETIATLRWILALAAAGATALIWHGAKRSAVLVLTWLGTSLGLLAYSVVQNHALSLPALVPSFHFYLYARAALLLLAGHAIAILIGLTVTFAMRNRSQERAGAQELVATLSLLVFGGGFVLANMPAYLSRPAFHQELAIANQMTWDFDSSRIVERLREQTPADAVILASLTDSIFLVGPAGRAVVALPREFSNPYVRVDQRLRDNQSLLLEFCRNDAANLRQLAAEYHVSHVLLREQTPGDAVPTLPAGAALLSWQGDLSLYALNR